MKNEDYFEVSQSEVRIIFLHNLLYYFYFKYNFPISPLLFLFLCSYILFCNVSLVLLFMRYTHYLFLCQPLFIMLFNSSFDLILIIVLSYASFTFYCVSWQFFSHCYDFISVTFYFTVFIYTGGRRAGLQDIRYFSLFSPTICFIFYFLPFYALVFFTLFLRFYYIVSDSSIPKK